ncbi:pentraxin fusion protein-like [Pristis pectinata]|uniref:pentraxin fusion protein-like n=1 Tax=Pristis pectinata TaxID=685728 RepID=UPI00223D6BF8|nr:pentraxin fusion protein-like [Pristis pectinata]
MASEGSSLELEALAPSPNVQPRAGSHSECGRPLIVSLPLFPGRAIPLQFPNLQQKHQVWSIRVTNTEGDPSKGIEGAEIRIGDSFHNSGNDNPRCATVQSISLGAAETFDCGGMQGRHVNIVRPGRQKHLTLCEVEVFAQPLFIIQAG